MSEQPTYWKHDRSGAIYRVNNAIGEDEFYPVWNFTENRTAYINCNPREHNSATHVTQIPLPQVGEKWTNGDTYLIVNDAVMALEGEPLDRFMLNYQKVEEKAEEETVAETFNRAVRVDMNVLGEPEYSFPFEPIEKEMERLKEDMQEIEEEQSRLGEQYVEMKKKHKAYFKMHCQMVDFLDTWGKL